MVKRPVLLSRELDGEYHCFLDEYKYMNIDILGLKNGS